MSYKLNDQEFLSVSALEGAKRYSHFIKRIADWQKVWSLRDDEGSSERACLVFWPHPRYAEALATGEWLDFKAAAIELEDFLNRLLPKMEDDEMMAGVFPVPSGRGVFVEPKRLRADLELELAKYE
jgi:hypothetical protein